MIGGPVRVEVTVRQGALVLKAVATKLGDDLVVAIGGGARPHVGCAVLAQPHPSTADPERSSSTASTLVIPPHRDDAIARTVADALARGLGVVVLAAAGVHTDDLDASGISTYRRLARRLADRLLAALRDRS